MPCRITLPSSSGSMLPPESTATAGVSNAVGLSRSAATAAAPAGSTTILARSISASSARDSDSSETVTISSTWSRTAAKVMSPGRPTAMPSAIVRHRLQRPPGRRRASEPGYAAAPAACTPTTRTSGRSALTAIAIPASSPPPPVGTSTVVDVGRLLEDLEPAACPGRPRCRRGRRGGSAPRRSRRRTRGPRRARPRGSGRGRPRRRRSRGSPSPWGSARPRA